MPFLEPIFASLLISCVTIWYGITQETRFVSRGTILLNALTVFVILFSLNISSGLAFLLILYAVFGLVLRKTVGKQYLKFWYGAKIFGSLTLAIGMVEFWQIENITGGILFWWLIFSLLTFGIFGAYLKIRCWIRYR